jgi:hypothetical protein
MGRSKVKLTVVFIMLSIYSYSQQGLSNHWLLGYDSQAGGPPGGINHLNFISGSLVITYDSLGMEFNHTHANISDSLGNILFYTNGVYIANASNDTMQNGSGINPGAYSTYVPDGHLIPQSALIIKKPGPDNLYYMFHSTIDNFPQSGFSVAHYLYLSIIDMDQNGGLGSVVLKNFPVITDTLNCGKITATRHANGRDWWVVCHRAYTNMYYKLLVTPFGMPSVSSQNIGSVRQWDIGQAKFSPDGNKFAYYHYFDGLDIMDFDRCTGMFSNCISDTSLPFIPGNVGCEFSSTSQFLYVANILKVYQYEVTAVNILSTKTEVAIWDSFAQPGIPQLGAYLCIPQLAPDGKIYITTGNSTTYLTEIEFPYLPGTFCNVLQHNILLPAYYFNTLPNHPNYFLGEISGSPCDTVTSIKSNNINGFKVNSYPNPTNGKFTLTYSPQSNIGIIEIYNINGELILKDYIPPWSQFKNFDFSHLINGIYFFNISWPEKVGKVKMIKLE